MPPATPRPHALRALAVAVLSWALVAASLSAQDFPAHVGKVNDFASVLSPAQREHLEADLADLERDTAAEMAVVTVTSLGGQDVSGYATGLFNAWGIGKQDRDNGVLVLVSPSDRVMRIEVGYGLEPILPDGLAGAIIRETFLPRFRDGAYADGLLAGAARVIDLVRRNETVTPEQRAEYAAAAFEASTSWGVAAFFALFVAVGAFTAGTGAGAKVVPQALFGVVFAGGAMFGAVMLAPHASRFVLALLGVAVAALGVKLGQRPKWRRSIRGMGPGAGGTGWTAGSSSSSSSSGSGSGSSSSGSFGGGSSGGGGASGSW
ncbi:MAG: TPM domain-containing protein [Acidobacteriota bacterium]